MTLSPPSTAKRPRAKRVVGQRQMSLTSFRTWKPENGWKYDWDNGVATRSCAMTTEEQRFIVRNLNRKFVTTTCFARREGDLLAECEIHTSPGQVRIPDVAFFSAEYTAARQRGEQVVPGFLIEIISKTDNGLTYMKKAKEYFSAGAKVVWLIYPELRTVYVYRSMKEVVVAEDGDTCSAMPAVDFSITVADLFHP
jgi:Uma2 family endonuclease